MSTPRRRRSLGLWFKRSNQSRRLVELRLEALARGHTTPSAVNTLLTGPRQLWWHCCHEAVQNDPSWLTSQRALDLLNFIGDQALSTSNDSDRAQAVYATALAVSCSDDTDAVERWLVRVTEYWATAPQPAAVYNGHQPGPETFKLPKRLWPDVATATSGTSNDSATELSALVALLSMAAPTPHNRDRARISVAFASPDTHGGGLLGRLELTAAQLGVTGIYPDPTSAARLATDEAFKTSLARAWATLPHRKRDVCVLWSLSLDAAEADAVPATAVDGSSLGVAFALALKDLTRFPAPVRRPMRTLRGYFHGMRWRTAVTGALDATGAVEAVDRLDAKIDVVQSRGWRLVAPRRNLPPGIRAGASAVGDSAGTADSVAYADDLAHADRLARRWNRRHLVISGVIALLLAAPPSALAVRNASQQSRQTRVAAANRWADVAESQLNANAALAQYIAADAYAEAATPQTRSVLLRALVNSPHMVAAHAAPASVTAVGSSGDGSVILAGAHDGTVTAWDQQGQLRTVLRMHAPVTDLAADHTGDLIAAITGAAAEIWSAPASGQATIVAPRLPPYTVPTAIGVSPSGRYVIIVLDTTVGYAPLAVLIVDAQAGQSSIRTLGGSEAYYRMVAVPSDGQFVLFDGGSGAWQTLSLPDAILLGGSSIGFPNYNLASALAAGGGFFSYTGLTAPTSVWATHGTPGLDTPQRTADVGSDQTTALALSADGTELAEANGTAISVAATVTPASAHPPAVVLDASGPVTSNALAFVGDSTTRLVSASGSYITLWDLDQYSRIAAAYPVSVSSGCDACGAPLIDVAPGGGAVAIVDGSSNALTVRRLGPTGASDLGDVEDPGGNLGPPLWSADGSYVIAPNFRTDASTLLSPLYPSQYNVAGGWTPSENQLQLPDPPAALARTPGGSVIEVETSGTIKKRDASTGTVTLWINGPRDMSPTAGTDAPLSPQNIAIDTATNYVAVLDQYAPPANSPGERLYVTSLETKTQRVLNEPEGSSITYDGATLLVQQPSGALQLWDDSGSDLRATLSGVASTRIATDGSNTLAEAQNSDITLIDLPSGYALGNLPLPSIASDRRLVALQFAPNGAALVIVTPGTTIDAQIVDWNLDIRHWMAIACATAVLNLTSDQWRQYTNGPLPTNPACGAI